MSRRVATITLNPAYDLVGFCPEIERGEVNLVKTTGLHAAGKGINVAAGTQRGKQPGRD